MIASHRTSLRRVLSSALAITAAVASRATAQDSAAARPTTPPATTQLPTMIAAFNAANTIREPAARLAALEKVRSDYPTLANTVDNSILTTLIVSFPDRVPAITETFDRIIARIPAAATPDARLTSLSGPISALIGRKVLLDRADQLLTETIAALDFEKYATNRKETAQRLRQPEPTEASLKTGFNATRGRGLEMLGRVQLARGDSARGEATFKEAVAASPSYGIAMMSLVDVYVARNDFAGAEHMLEQAIAAASIPPSPTTGADGRIVISGGVMAAGATAAVPPMMALANLYLKKGDEQKAEARFKEVLTKTATHKPALLALAKLETKRGDSQAALDHYMLASIIAGSMASDDESTMRALFRKTGGNDAALEGELDKRYREHFPNPVKPQPYTPGEKRSDRVVLLEMFTGSGCPPCVSADLALDAAMERYPADAVIAVNYHMNIPAPDPMVVSSGDGRARDYYGIRGVPTFNIDGTLGQLGGGARERAQATYTAYLPKIDKALESPAGAAIDVSAIGSKDQISVTANVSKLPADAKDLRLHILLVERELKYSGENGVRFHPMVVRAVAGDRGAGIPIAANGTTKHTFSLKAIREDVANTLKAELEKRGKAQTPGSPPRNYMADGHAYTAIDSTKLVVVAFVQQGKYIAPGTTAAAPPGFESAASDDPPSGTPARPAPAVGVAGPNVLQAAKADVLYVTPKGKGGNH